MSRNGIGIVVVFVAVVGVLLPSGSPPVYATPSATNDTTYAAYGRVFPDSQGCTKGAPGNSPWAKGKVCAAHFLQWDETLAGLRYLQAKFPRYGRLENLRDLRATVPEFANLDMQSAGLPTTTLDRDRRDLYVFVVTDRDSPVPEPDRHRYSFSLSIHGIERAGLEGGVRAAEDLMTWAATAPNTRILEPTNSGPTAAEVVRDNVLYFVLANPDGWGRGEISKGGVFFQRYNGNGADENRDFPADGYANPVYTPFAEPETTGYAAYLLREKQRSSAKAFRGGGDLHGMLAADSFSYTMLSGTAETWAENHRLVSAAETIYRDAAKRLVYSPLIADPLDCPGDIPVFLFITGGSAPMCPDQWGTVWDTIDYQTTGSFGDWMSSDIGLGATAIDNEMAYSHLTPNNVYNPFVEQLHIDGNKGIIYAQIAALTTPTVAPPVTVAAGYAPSVNRKVRTADTPRAVAASLRPQASLVAQEELGRGVEFAVKGPADGVQNGGLVAEFTFTNVDGISTETVSDVRIERFGVEHPGDAEGWHEVGSWYRQELGYLPAGARIDINDPEPGRYRLAPAPMLRHGITRMDVRFTADKAVPEPNLPYDVANTDVFKNLGPSIRAVAPAAVLANPRALDGLSAYALADDPAPGVAATDRAAWFAALKAFVNRGGTLVLTDNALDALVDLGVVAQAALIKGVEYGGWISFTDTQDRPTWGAPLAAGLNREGASSGSGAGLELRRQTYDPGAVGYPINAQTGPNCFFRGPCKAPQVLIAPDAWNKAGGSIAGRASVVPTAAEGPDRIGVAYGELKLGAGRIRIAGGLLPTPTQAYSHPYGLEGFGLSWTGWQVLVNLLSTAATVPANSPTVLGVSVIPRTGAATAPPLDIAALVITLAAAARVVRVTRSRRKTA
ncbi:MAG TPA: hypothetical protein VMZ22_02390 [Acidimicrobiales bacterium]|nr:hypothetical protein [Acidimicrobiales bacterium]